jgi:DNA-binding beta-propeller fold protein YncE
LNLSIIIIALVALTNSLPEGTLLVAYDGCQVNLYNEDGSGFTLGNGDSYLTVAAPVTNCKPTTKLVGVCLGKDGNVFAVDNSNKQILQWDNEGAFVAALDISTITDPTDCSVDRAGNIYIGGDNSVVKFDSAGNVLAEFLAPSGEEPFSVELNPKERRLYFTTRTLNVYYLDLARAGAVQTLYTQVVASGTYGAQQIKVSANGDVVVAFSGDGENDFIVRLTGADRRDWKGDAVTYANRFPSDQDLVGVALENENRNVYVQSQGSGIYDDVYKVSYKAHGLHYGWNVDGVDSSSVGLEVVPRQHRRTHNRSDDESHEGERHHHELESLLHESHH